MAEQSIGNVETSSTDLPPTTTPPSSAPLSPRAEADAAKATLRIFRSLFGKHAEGSFAIRLWDGQEWANAPGEPPRFKIVLNHPGALRKMLLPPAEAVLGEAFIRGDFDVEGDLVACTALADAIGPTLANPLTWPLLLRDLASLPKTSPAGYQWRGAARLAGEEHSQNRDQAAVTYHYDLPGEFYGLFLDRRMQYSCAYFRTDTETLDAAQEAKLEHICRKLQLKPGERLLDIGCGWGGLIAYAAERYGVEALGITISRGQADLTRKRIQEAGLGERCRVELLDYRQMNEPNAFDKIVSVGMFEHVGRGKLATYFARAHRLLRPGGIFLNHGIASMYVNEGRFVSLVHRLLSTSGDFMQRYVFPDGELVPVSDTTSIAERAGFEVRDVEGLREHYAQTLRHWLANLDARREEALAMVDLPTYRVWRLYIAGCAHAFDTAKINVYQAILVKPDRHGCSGMPWTREYLYQ
ncbi:MAG: cyclopropane-fatty-acyl-phospholipid synthase [Dehalococcoidales bacterium]|nr:cyclopropane-fatty-acyl-phospholipid synthase [Dehalococcoidales bacterium]